ncbi:MAG TPA: pseudouridine synthase [Methanosarcinales archaeon]|nr:pseudouridine synthase [Methanosarcinales archaeon]
MQKLKKVRIIADYQFGRGAGKALFPENVEFQLSNTKRVRQILLNGKRLATLRAKDGLFTLSIYGADRLHKHFPYPHLRVVMNKEASPFIAQGKTAFARHVVAVDPEIRAGEEVILVDENDKLLATGKTLLCASEMLSFKKGVAVYVRQGVVVDNDRNL